ncbi:MULTISPECIES: LysR family transcriptional regulator [unclassified Streptococcus]|uniref:LysR family transcriptional regulator n=1 Tax=unclassified Streptococcus TaxID=2608887 RepID=UPI00066FE0FA|nr:MULTISPECIES: LysR family transcriptional regulator [unclassified Streptococcus]
MSHHIKFLEDKYGVPLFIRQARNLQLTRAGNRLFAAFQTIHNDENRIAQELKELAKEQQQLTFGLTMTIGEFTLASTMVRYIQAHPETNIVIHYKNNQTLDSSRII